MYILPNEEDKLSQLFPKAHDEKIKTLYEEWRRAASGKNFDLHAAKNLASELIARMQTQRQASTGLEWWIRDITGYLEARRSGGPRLN